MNYKIEEVGLDITNLDYSPTDIERNKYNYIHTNISANNAYLIKDSITDDTTIFTTIDFIDGAEMAIAGHLIELGRYSLSTLLIDARCNLDKASELVSSLKDAGTIEYVGISNPKTIDNLVDANARLNFDYVSLDICPLNFNFEVIQWSIEHGKKIIGFNPFGGYINSPNLIKSFTVPFLLNFISYYANLVFLSSRDLLYSDKNRSYLHSLIGKEVDSDLYTLNENVFKLTPPLKKTIFSSIKLDENTILPIDDTEYFFDSDELNLTTGEPKEVIPETIDAKDDVLKAVLNYLKDVHISTDGTDSDMLALLRYGILSIIRSIYRNIDGKIEITQTKLCKNTIIINVLKTEFIKRGWFTHLTENTSTDYVLYYHNKTMLFKDIEEGSQNPSES